MWFSMGIGAFLLYMFLLCIGKAFSRKEIPPQIGNGTITCPKCGFINKSTTLEGNKTYFCNKCDTDLMHYSAETFDGKKFTSEFVWVVLFGIVMLVGTIFAAIIGMHR